MLKLQFRDQPGNFIKLSEAAITLGRDESNDVVINHPSVSDFHAEILNDAQSPMIVDLLSASGTFVNEHRISGRCQLNAWDVIRLGTAELEVTDPNTHRPEDWALRSESDLLATQFHALNESTVIGRDPACDITIDSNLLSRRHARLVVENDRLQITDLGSANGTYLNGEKIEEAYARPGDELRFDQHRFIIVGPVAAVSPGEESATEKTIIRHITEDATVLAEPPALSPDATVLVASEPGDDTVLVASEETLQYIPPPPTATLTEIGPSDPPRVLTLEGQTQEIGRSDDCEFVLKDTSVSKHHAELVFADDQWMVRDLGSSNGVLVNLERVDQVALHSGDRVQLGRLEFEFKLLEENAPGDDSATKVFQPPQPPETGRKTDRDPRVADKPRKSALYRWLAGLGGLALIAGATLLWLKYR